MRRHEAHQTKNLECKLARSEEDRYGCLGLLVLASLAFFFLSITSDNTLVTSALISSIPLFFLLCFWFKGLLETSSADHQALLLALAQSRAYDTYHIDLTMGEGEKIEDYHAFEREVRWWVNRSGVDVREYSAHDRYDAYLHDNDYYHQMNIRKKKIRYCFASEEDKSPVSSQIPVR